MEYENPKNWYIRLNENFFDTKEIKILRSFKNGKDYIILLLQLRLLTINTDGKLQFNDTIPYDEEMLSDLTGTEISLLKESIKVFVDLGLATILDNNVIYMEEVENLIGYVSREAKRKADYRKRKKEEETDETFNGTSNGTLSPNSNSNINSNSNSNSIIEIDKEKEEKTKKEKLEKLELLFEKFWEEYPRKVSKAKAKEKFFKLNPNEELYKLIMMKLKLYKQTKQWGDIEFVPHAITWLNQKRYEDEIDIKDIVNEKLKSSPALKEMLRRKSNE